MGDSLHSALEALQRSSHDPASFSRSFLDMFPVTGAAVSTLGALLGSQTISASDLLAAELDELQFDFGEGPCWDAMNLARPVLEPDVLNNPRTVWPTFSPALAERHVASLFAFPLMLGALRIGAVDLYSARPVELNAAQARDAGALADAVGRHVLRRALDDIGGEYNDEGNAFSRRLIHQATGMVLAQLHLPADDARLVIQGHAYATSRPMMEVAQDIVDRTLTFSRSASGIESS